MKEFNNDKDNFNKSLKKKFDASGIEPSNAVWEGIEGALLKHENVKMQKAAVFYRNIAAAVLIIAAVSIYFNVQEVFNGSNQSIETVDITSVESNESNYNLYGSQSDIIAPPQITENETEVSNSSETVLNSKVIKNLKESSNAISDEQGFAVVPNNIGEDSNSQNFLLSDQDQDNDEKIYSKKTLAVALNESDLQDKAIINDLSERENYLPNAIALSNAGINRIDNIAPGSFEAENIITPEVEVEDVAYFAISNLDKVNKSSGLAFQSAFNVGSGSFNPNANSSAGAPQPGFAALGAPGSAGRTSNDAASQEFSAERQIVDDLSNAPIRSNISMTFGLHFGVHLNERLKIRTGLQYGNYRSSTESSAVIRDINSDQIFPYHGASNATELADGKIVNITSEYNVYNDFQILSVPLLVSYKFLDRKFGIGLMAGATADIMLRNTIRGGDDQISEISFENNESQSYKNLFYSGVAGVEFSYNFTKNYSLSLTPTYKKAFMNITNDNASFNSAPDFLSVDMSLQFTF